MIPLLVWVPTALFSVTAIVCLALASHSWLTEQPAPRSGWRRRGRFLLR